MMSKKHVVETMVLLVIASLFLAGFYYQNQESHHQEETAQELLLKKEEEIKQYISKTKNTTFKNALLTSNEGAQVQLSDYKFRPKVVVFWASWCPDCQKELPIIQRLYDKYQDKVDFFMVDIVDGERETLETSHQFLRNQGFTFPVYIDQDLQAFKFFDVKAIPTIFIVDKDGIVKQIYVEQGSEEILSKDLKQLIND